MTNYVHKTCAASGHDTAPWIYLPYFSKRYSTGEAGFSIQASGTRPPPSTRKLRCSILIIRIIGFERKVIGGTLEYLYTGGLNLRSLAF